MSQTLTPVDSITTIIVCPTPAGGHIEHACDLALATLDVTGTRATVLTRPGAVKYLPKAASARIDIREVIPPLIDGIDSPSRVERLGRAWKQTQSLIREHLRIRAELRAIPGSKVLVLEEARYPIPQLLLVDRKSSKLCLMLHNAVEHTISSDSTKLKVKPIIAALVKASVDYIAVHGDRQRELVEKTVRTPVRSFPLPGDSYLNMLMSDEMPMPKIAFSDLAESFVCLGEIRENKGIELAIEAAKLSGVKLLVIGRAIDLPYFMSIKQQAMEAPNVEIRDEFVSAEGFEQILTSCRAIVLPYTQFDAQSGVLARALAKKAVVIASDIPSLREQAADAHNFQPFELGSAVALAEAMRTNLSQELARTANAKTYTGSIPKWNDMAEALQAGW